MKKIDAGSASDVDAIVKRLNNLGAIDAASGKKCTHCEGPKHFGVCCFPKDWFKGIPLAKIEARMNAYGK